MKKVLSIAGSDCSGGAGIQADLKTFSALAVFGMSVIVSVVAENTVRVLGCADIPPCIIKKQMDAIFEDMMTDAVKIGMLSGKSCMQAVAESLRLYRPKNVVIDPVMYAKGGCPLMDESSVDYFIKEIIPFADILTPNIPEAERLARISIKCDADAREAAKKILTLGCKSVIIKGSHADGNPVDILFKDGCFTYFDASRINTKNTHGTGCTFSSAIAAFLAQEYSIIDAVKKAKEYVTGAILHSLSIGKGHGPLNHFYKFFKEN